MAFVLGIGLLHGQNNNQPDTSKYTFECDFYNNFFASNRFQVTLDSVARDIYEGGIIIIDDEKAPSNGVFTFDDLYPYLNLDSNYTFEQLTIHDNFIIEGTVSIRYQQYFQGLEVEGGGYSAIAYRPDGPGDPCLELYALTPYIINDIELDTSDIITLSNLLNIINTEFNIDSIYDSLTVINLVISPNLDNDCKIMLTYRVKYFDEGYKQAYLDALTGDILRVEELSAAHNAPTEVYGTQWLNDKTSNNLTRLVSPNESIKVYNFSHRPDCRGNSYIDYTANLIPSTSHANTWNADPFNPDASPALFQAFHMAEIIRPEFSKIGIEFESIHLGVNCPEDNSYALGFEYDPCKPYENAFITIGRNSANASWAVRDVVAHELMHYYLLRLFPYSGRGNTEIAEGLCDIFGNYIETQLQFGNSDWVYGDDSYV